MPEITVDVSLVVDTAMSEVGNLVESIENNDELKREERMLCLTAASLVLMLREGITRDKQQNLLNILLSADIPREHLKDLIDFARNSGFAIKGELQE